MTTSIRAHFDGKVIVPDEPVTLPVGQELQVTVKTEAKEQPRHADLLKFVGDFPDLPADYAVQHDHYL